MAEPATGPTHPDGRADELDRALRELRFNSALTADEVWVTPEYHVDGLHPQAERFIERGIDDAARDTRSHPVGVVVEGQGGSGKTHLLGLTRRAVHQRDGYFFLIDFSTGSDFWLNVARQMCSNLNQEREGTGRTQIAILLRHLALRAGVTNPVAEAISGTAPLSATDLRTFLMALGRIDRDLAVRSHQTLRALALFASADFDHQLIGDNHLTCQEPLSERERERRIDWHLVPESRHPKSIVEDLIRIMAVSGPSVIAIDQIDAWVDAAVRPDRPAPWGDTGSVGGDGAGGRGGGADGDGADQPRSPFTLGELANGLMDLRQIARRALCVVSCIPASWSRIRREAVSTVQDRYRSSLVLGTITDPAAAEALIARRLATVYRRVGFTPPHPTWPVSATALPTAVDRTPRSVLQAIERHADGCVDRGRADELTSFAERSDPPPPSPPIRRPGGSRSAVTPPKPPPGDPDELALAALDQRYVELMERFDPSRALDPATEDAQMPRLLAGALTAWIAEQDDGHRFKADVSSERRPVVHGRLREILDPETERQRQWSFRAISHDNAVAVQTRLRNAIDRSDLDRPDRWLVILRIVPWPSGPKTDQMVEDLLARGGMVIQPTLDDLACFHALRYLTVVPDPILQTWLQRRRPASGTTILRSIDRSLAMRGHGLGPDPGHRPGLPARRDRLE